MMFLAEHFPLSRFAGYDISAEAVDWANAEAARRGLANVRFTVQDAAALGESEAFDAIFTFDAVHDQAHPAAVLKNIHRALRPGGIYLMQDIGVHTAVDQNLDHPIAPLIYSISCMHCMTVSLAAGGAGLGAAWGVELAEEMVRAAGFERVEIHRLPHDLQNAYFVLRK